ncbi:MAG: tyrosine-type recombinase/integrase, partial [Candidatus Saccharimonadales bacterium]
VLRLPNETTRDYILFCFFTGWRRSATAKLKWSYFNKRSGIMTIPNEDDKTRKERRIPLPDIAIQILERRSKLPRPIDNDYIFPVDPQAIDKRKRTGTAGPKYIQEPKRGIAKVVKDSGVYFSMHVLKNTFLTTASRLDIAHYKLKALGFHSVKGDVTGGYVQTDPEQLREPMQKICDYLREQCGAKATFAEQIEAVS